MPDNETPEFNQKTLNRYKKNYGLSNSVGINEVKAHWDLERELTKKILSSTQESRWQVFDECYTKLYSEIHWLHSAHQATEIDYSYWSNLIKSPSRILEIGSGQGKLLEFLAQLGNDCVATEITKERGEKHVRKFDNIRWKSTDGVNLSAFEDAESYDFVISSQVIEHLHPDDIKQHFSQVNRILRRGGIYFFDTPHRGSGPADLSRVFEIDNAVCMHLKEYTTAELTSISYAAGFGKVEQVMFSKRPRIGPTMSGNYLRYCIRFDDIIAYANLNRKNERKLRQLLKLLLLPTNIWIGATK